MSYADRLTQFGNADFLPEGWFWLCESADLKKKTAMPIKFWKHDFVLFRTEGGEPVLMDAHCPHMGAHLCDGFVEGEAIRCPFHLWKFDNQGTCVDIPAQADCKHVPRLKTYKTAEAYGLVWIWTGNAEDAETIPVIPELRGFALDWARGTPFTKNCHANVMMINAIDAQHFKSVHNLVVDMDMRATEISERCIQFSNTRPIPKSRWYLRFFSKFYAGPLTYEMTYWWGHTGSVMVGPDFLHCYIIFALRPTDDGRAAGQTILVTKKRAFGWLLNPVILYATKLVGNYFAKGDTMIFSRIKFKFQTPLKADRTIVEFVEHYEKQKPASFLDQPDTRRSHARRTVADPHSIPAERHEDLQAH